MDILIVAIITTFLVVLAAFSTVFVSVTMRLKPEIKIWCLFVLACSSLSLGFPFWLLFMVAGIPLVDASIPAMICGVGVVFLIANWAQKRHQKAKELPNEEKD